MNNEETPKLEDLIYSTKNRIMIAEILMNLGKTDLLDTILEDLYFGVQQIMLNYCVKDDE